MNVCENNNTFMINKKPSMNVCEIKNTLMEEQKNVHECV